MEFLKMRVLIIKWCYFDHNIDAVEEKTNYGKKVRSLWVFTISTTPKMGEGGGGLSLRSIKRRPIDALKRKYITFHVGIGNILAATVSRSWKKW
jgi:hypothetical protein